MANVTASPKGPRKLRDVAGFAAAEDRLAELKGRQAEARAALRDVEARLATLSTDGAAALAIHEKAEALVAGRDPATAGPDAAALRREHRDLVERVAVLGRALELQKEVLAEQRAKASPLVAEAHRAEHRELALGVIRAALALAQANAQERAFRNALAEAGVDYLSVLWPMEFLPGRIGQLNDQQSHVAMLVKEALEFDFVDGSEDFLRPVSCLPELLAVVASLREPAAGPVEKAAAAVGKVVGAAVGNFAWGKS
jgi:hypothetical protein